MSAKMVALSHSELMAQHKDLGVLPPPLPPRQPSSDAARVTTKKISLKPTSRRSSHALAGSAGPSCQGSAEHPAQVAQVFGTHSLAEMRLIVTPGTIMRWQAAPLRPLPDGVTDLDHFRVQRRDRTGGVIHEYRLVA